MINKFIECPPCKYCGAEHGMDIKTMATGEIEPIDICSDCLWNPKGSNLTAEWGGNMRCMTSDGRNVNMAEELNRLEKENREKMQKWNG